MKIHTAQDESLLNKNSRLLKIKKITAFSFLFFLAVSVYSQTSTNSRLLYVKTPMMHGEDVKTVQAKLIEMGFSEVINSDGYYDGATEEAVKTFQALAGFTPNGIISEKEREFFNRNDSRTLMSAIYIYNKYKEAKRIIKQTEYDFARFAGKQLLSVYMLENKPAFCNLEEIHTDYSGDFNVFKVNDTFYFLVSREFYPDIPDGANPWERARFDDVIKDHAYCFINGTLYDVQNGILVEDNDEAVIKLITDCINYFL